MVVVLSSDINECMRGNHTCDGNALCSDTDGSFNCTCNNGYTGSGMIGECLGGYGAKS